MLNLAHEISVRRQAMRDSLMTFIKSGQQAQEIDRDTARLLYEALGPADDVIQIPAVEKPPRNRRKDAGVPKKKAENETPPLDLAGTLKDIISGPPAHISTPTATLNEEGEDA